MRQCMDESERPIISTFGVLADDRAGRRGVNTLLFQSARRLQEVQISATVEIWLCGPEPMLPSKEPRPR